MNFKEHYRRLRILKKSERKNRHESLIGYLHLAIHCIDCWRLLRKGYSIAITKPTKDISDKKTTPSTHEYEKKTSYNLKDAWRYPENKIKRG